MENRRKVLEYFENPNSNWKSEAAENINRYRKGDVKIKLTGKEGNPIPNAEIRAVQKTHEFNFGANIFMLDELETEEKNRTYKEKFKSLFNMATLPFYWKDTEPEKGKTRYEIGSPRVYRRPPVELCLKFCEENGIEPREHALAYDNFYPEWLKGLSVEEVKAEMEHHFKELGERYADRIHNIEVTNEMFWGKENGVTSFYAEPDFVEWCFKTARKYFPNNKLIINEADYGNKCDKYCDYIEENLKKDAPIDAVAIQYHIFTPPNEEIDSAKNVYNPEVVSRVLDKLSKFGKPVQVSEVTIAAYSNKAEDEEIQAKLLEYLYTLWFSAPLAEQIVYWNLVDGYAFVRSTDPEVIKHSQGDMTLGENVFYGGLLRFDLTEKPAYKMLKKLIHEIWHTEKTLVTDENGEITFRGFYGNYELFVNGKKLEKTVPVSKNIENIFTIGVKNEK